MELLLVGILGFATGLIGLQLARPKAGRPRSFVGTSLEVPIVLAILGCFGVGLILTIWGVAEMKLWSA